MRITLITTLLILACAIIPNQACHTYSMPDTDEITQGPYWVDEKLNRSNITAGQQGSPFTLTLRLFNKTAVAAACAATASNETNQPLMDGTGVISGAQIDIWYANASGHYSDYQVEGTLGLNFLRGYQLTNSSGYVTFYGFFPGWYTSRTAHIHIRVRLYDTNGTNTYDDTTQLFFDDTFSDSVYAANSVYNHGTRDTYDSNDNLYQSAMLMNTTGTLATGYFSNFNLYYPFTTVSSSSSNSTSGGGPSGAGTPPSGTGGGPGGAGTPPPIPTSSPSTTPTTTSTTSAPTSASNTTTTTNAPTSTATTTSAPTSTSNSTTAPTSSPTSIQNNTSAASQNIPSFLIIIASIYSFIILFQ